MFVSTGLCGGMFDLLHLHLRILFGDDDSGGLGLSLAYVIASLVIGYSVTSLGLNVATRIRRA